MVQNCKYCGLCSCTEEKPLCDEQKSGKYSDHPARQFQVGDWIKHTDDRIGVVAFVRPLEFGVRVHFCYKISPKKQTCDWYQPEKLTKVNDEVYLPYDGYGALIQIGDTIMYVVAKGGAGNGPCIKSGTVQSIEERPSHRGYGYYTRQLKIKLIDGGKIITHNYPSNCLVKEHLC